MWKKAMEKQKKFTKSIDIYKKQRYNIIVTWSQQKERSKTMAKKHKKQKKLSVKEVIELIIEAATAIAALIAAIKS